MIQNYLTTALRAIRTEKFYSLTNLFGLSIGIASFLIAALYLNHELRYDQHFDNHENIYRIATTRSVAGLTTYSALGPPQIGPILTQDFPEVLSYVNFTKLPTVALYRDQDSPRDWKNFYATDPNVFDVFSHNIIYGDPQSALTQPQSIAISDEMAFYYFGAANPIGEILREEAVDYTVTLVFERLPSNTHLKYDALTYHAPNSLTSAEGARRVVIILLAENYYTYLQMSPNYDASQFSDISKQFFDSNVSSFEGAASLEHDLELLSDIHLNSTTERDLARGDKAMLYILAALVVSLLSISTINYVNLATARSNKRAKEIGTRKVLGAESRQLFTQFMLESLFFVILAFLLALIFLSFALDFSYLDSLLGGVVSLSQLRQPAFLFGIVFSVLTVALLAGIYPASYLSTMSPNATMKVSSMQSTKGISVRKALLTLQFMVSVLVISCTYLMFSQLTYLEERPLGYDKENKIAVELIGLENIKKLGNLITELEAHPSIIGATVTQEILGEVTSTSTPGVETNDGAIQRVPIAHLVVDENYLDVMGIELLKGRNLDPANRDEIGRTNLVNEAFVRFMGWEQPIGKRVGSWPVIGVVKDFNFRSLHEQVEPLVLRLDQENLENEDLIQGSRMRRTIVISLTSANHAETLRFVETRWATFFPDQAFAYEFIDARVEQHYATERRQSTLIGLMATLCVVISTLGILTMATFDAEQRKREIAVRRVLGASAVQIVIVQVKQLLAPLVVAILAGSAASYYAISLWLQNFYYRQNMDVMALVYSGILMMIVVFGAAAVQSYRGVRDNPVYALRYE